MKALIHKRYILRQNLFAVIGLCLCFYFSYHALLGDRSYLKLMTLNHQVEQMAGRYDDLHAQKTALERRVSMMRPGSIDPDLLEERARHVLGYTKPGERVVLSAD